MKLPKKWRGFDGRLSHVVAVNKDPGVEIEIVTYKVWSRRKGWRYFAQTRKLIEWEIEFIRQRNLEGETL